LFKKSEADRLDLKVYYHSITEQIIQLQIGIGIRISKFGIIHRFCDISNGKYDNGNSGNICKTHAAKNIKFSSCKVWRLLWYYQGNFHFGLGNASLSIPPGYPPYTPGAMCIPDYSATDGSIHIIYVLRFRGHLAENNLPAIFFSTSAISFHYFTSGTV
jgi:hypothetical protein